MSRDSPSVSLGPVEVAVIEFEGNRFKGDIVPALAEVVDLGIIRIIDIVFVTKDESGSVRGVELDALADEEAEAVAPVTDDVMGLLSEEDVRRVGAALPKSSSAAMVVFEHSWAARLQQAIRDADGRLVAMERIPVDVVEQAAAAAQP
jgi:Family of unknown function (DUF6325)